MGKLLLSSYYNHKAIITNSHNCVIFNIAKKPMYGIPQLLGLAPNSDLLNWALSNKSKVHWFDKYYYRYIDEVASTGLFSMDIDCITNFLDRDMDVMLLCWCMNYDECHRRIVGKLIESKGYIVCYS